MNRIDTGSPASRTGPSASTARPAPRLLPAAACVAVLVWGTTACGDDPLVPPGEERTAMGVVLNSVDLSLTVFPVDSPGTTRPPIGLGPDGSPAGLDVRGETAVVPMGLVPALAVVDLSEGIVARSVGLPAGSGATGSAFVNDSVVLVANSNLDTAVPVNVLRGTIADEIPVGGFPQGVAASETRVAVLNAELGEDFQPAGPGTLTVLDRETLAPTGTVTLSGTNPGGAVAVGDDLLYVVNSGSFGASDGSLSLVDLSVPVEVGHWTGFGEFPSAIAVGPGGRLHVGSFGYGIAIWDPMGESFVRGPDDAVAPDGTPSVSGIAFDDDGRLYTLRPDCASSGAVLRLSGALVVTDRWTVGTCPIALAFTEVEG